jgi:Type VI secretion system VasI, EvfG, VC_A0118
MRKTLAVCSLLWVASNAIAPASAQSILEIVAGLKFCRTLKDDAQRLKCFDRLVADKATEQPKTPETAATWTIEENKSPVDDSPQVTGTLHGIGDSGADAAFLMLRCKEKKTEAVFGRTFSFIGSSEPIKVLTRVNDGQAIETMWHPSTTGTGVFAPSAVQFIRSLPDNGKLFIRAFGFRGKQADGEFSLGKVSEIRDKISAACNWAAAASKPAAPPAVQPQPQKK